MRAAALALVLLGCGPEPVAQSRDAGVDASVPLAPMMAGELTGTVRALVSRGDVALEGIEFPLHAGALVIENDQAVAVVSPVDGRVVGFGPPRGKNGLEGFGPAAFDPFDELEGVVERIEPALEGRAIHVVKRLRARPLTIDAWYALRGPVLLLRWRMEAREAVQAVTAGEIVFWGNTPTWVEGQGFVEQGGAWSGDFLARESQGSSYAFCREDGRVMARFRSEDLPGYHRSARTGEQRIALEAGASTALRSVALALAPGSLGDAVKALPCRRKARTMEMPSALTGLDVEVAHCEREAEWHARIERQEVQPPPAPSDDAKERGAGPPYLRYRISERSFEAPEGCARVRLIAPGHAPGAWIDPERDDEHGWKHPKLAPRAGRIAWRIRDRDGAVLPATLVLRGEGGTADPDWGDEGKGGAAKNFIYAERDGVEPIPPGRYHVMVHRGFEYTMHEAALVVSEGQTATVSATLERAVDTAGWLTADLHVHAMPSFDAPTLLEDRVRSLAAVGVEVAVATDHNAVTDYRPAIAALDLEAFIASLVGDEVTTEEPLLGHFNVFPLAPGSAPLVFRGATPKELFAAARRASPQGVLQVNHPRMGDIGYFELFRFDRRAVDSWNASMSFDAIEIFNGDHYARIGEVEYVLEDWYALLDAGIRYTATGNSDSHKIAYQEAGMPRNFVAVAPDEPSRFDGAAFVRAVRAGHVVVSNGPFIDLSSGSARPGDTVPAGELELTVRVDAPPWMDVSTVELVRSRGVVRRWAIAGKPHPRLNATTKITVAAKDWLICIARGKASMPQYYRSGAIPFAFTNPIWAR